MDVIADQETDQETDQTQIIDDLVAYLKKGGPITQTHIQQIEKIIFKPSDVTWDNVHTLTDSLKSFDSAIALLGYVRPGWGHGYEMCPYPEVKYYDAWIWPSFMVNETEDRFWEPDWKLGQETYQDHPDGSRAGGPYPSAAILACLILSFKPREI